MCDREHRNHTLPFLIYLPLRRHHQQKRQTRGQEEQQKIIREKN